MISKYFYDGITNLFLQKLTFTENEMLLQKFHYENLESYSMISTLFFIEVNCITPLTHCPVFLIVMYRRYIL